MSKDKYMLNSISDMLKSLYPEKGHDTVNSQEIFYNKEALIDKLDYITNNEKQIYAKSTEENKKYLYYCLNIRLKELYIIYYKQYSKALDCNKDGIKDMLEKLFNGSHKLCEDDPNLPLIILEAFLRIQVNKKLDEEIYSALRLIFPGQTSLINTIPCGYPVYTNNGVEYEIGYNEDQLIEVMVCFCESIVEHKEFDIFNQVALYTLNLLYTTYSCFLDDSNVKKMSEDLNSMLERIQKCCIVKPNPIIKKAFTLIKTYCTIMIKVQGSSEEVLLNKDECSEIENNFASFIKSLKKKQCENCKAEIYEVIHEFIDISVCIEGDTEYDSQLYFMKILQQIKNDTKLPNFINEFLRECITDARYIRILFELKQYKTIVDIYYRNTDYQATQRFKFDCAFSLEECGDTREAEKLYLNLIEDDGDSSGAYNNLGVIYEKDYKDLYKAKDFYKKSLEVDPNNTCVASNLEQIIDTIKEIEEKPKKLKDIYFKKTKTWHKKVLFAIYKLSNQNTVKIKDLCESTNQSEHEITRNLIYLENLNLVITNQNSIMLEPAIIPTIRDYIDPQLERQIVKVDNSKLYRPIFYHESEIFMYRVLMELFPQHLVFPNISLKTLFDIDKMKELLNEEEMKYLFMAHVDYAIINTSSYFPVLAFEKDSDYNDTDYTKGRSEIKNKIFRIGGIPLIRLRFNNGLEYEKLKSEIKEATKSLILEYSKDNIYEVDFNKEFEVRRFGIVKSPIDLNLVKKNWEELVGIGAAQKSKIIDIENNKLTIEISNDLKPIIELSESTIKSKFIKKFDAIKDVVFSWY